jgi:phosphoglycolate phosphatase
MSQPIIVFDLDGTLIDTAPDLIATLNAVFANEGVPPVPYAQARALIGGGAKAMIARGLETESCDTSAPRVERLFVSFVDYYAQHLADQSRPFPGVEQTLDRLAAEHFRLAVCTNKLEGLARKLLETLGLAPRFAAICGQDTFGVQKPDPEILRSTIAAAGGDIDNAIMVGDSETDIRTARAAGVPIIAVDFGYTPRPIAEFHPDRAISHFNDLAAAVTELSQGLRASA